jgi:hypothetical protein
MPTAQVDPKNAKMPNKNGLWNVRWKWGAFIWGRYKKRGAMNFIIFAYD